MLYINLSHALDMYGTLYFWLLIKFNVWIEKKFSELNHKFRLKIHLFQSKFNAYAWKDVRVRN